MGSPPRSTELTRLGRALRRELEPLVKQHPDEFGFPNYMGACGVAAYAMCKLLRRLGSQPKLVMSGGPFPGSRHCWTEVDGFIVDLTATQFGYTKPVQVVTRRSEWHTPWLCEGRDALERLKTWDLQNPLKHREAIDAAVSRVLTPR